ncbi:MAG: ABC transporter ATP-binding protein [bacterium]
MSQAVINVEHVSKRFRLQFRGLRTLKSAAVDALRGVWRRPDRQLWALQDVSFSVRSGECLGLIGGNGAGKSTLLALLASTMQPTNGRIQVLGKVSSLLELGAGFHPDLTGRENIYLCGSILGLTRRQISERFEAIVDFAGLADFIDEPVKHYSSGMYIRLGFAVAVESDPDVLLIDEVLAVGDAPFQRKCLLRMADFRKQGKTMLIISHDLATIRSISDRILFLDKGRICGDGPPSMVVEQYENFWRQQNTKELSREWGTHEVELTSIEFLNDLGAATTTYVAGAALCARVRYRARSRIEKPVFGFSISDTNGRLIHGSNTQISGLNLPVIEGDGELCLRLPDLALGNGTHMFSFSVHSWDHKINYHRMDNAFPVVIKSNRVFDGCCYLPSVWEPGSSVAGGA